MAHVRYNKILTHSYTIQGFLVIFLYLTQTRWQSQVRENVQDPAEGDSEGEI